VSAVSLPPFRCVYRGFIAAALVPVLILFDVILVKVGSTKGAMRWHRGTRFRSRARRDVDESGEVPIALGIGSVRTTAATRDSVLAVTDIWQ